MDIDYALMVRVLAELPTRFNDRRKALGITVLQVWAQDPAVSLSALQRFASGSATGDSNIATYRVVLRFMARTDAEVSGADPGPADPGHPDGNR